MATFRKLPSGSWNVQVRLTGRPKVSNTFKTKVEAIRWAREQEAPETPSPHRPADTPRLSAILERYGKEVSPTKKGYRAELCRIALLKSHLGHLRLSSVIPRGSPWCSKDGLWIATGLSWATLR
jgi:hypothetical protein